LILVAGIMNNNGLTDIAFKMYPETMQGITILYLLKCETHFKTLTYKNNKLKLLIRLIIYYYQIKTEHI